LPRDLRGRPSPRWFSRKLNASCIARGAVHLREGVPVRQGWFETVPPPQPDAD